MRLVICRGLPGSGKTTRAREWVASCPEQRARVNRDDLRQMLHGVYLGEPTERQVRELELDTIRSLIRNGVDVVVDDTNLKPEIYDALLELADDLCIDASRVALIDLRGVPLDVCIARDADRMNPVGEETIRKMAADWL